MLLPANGLVENPDSAKGCQMTNQRHDGGKALETNMFQRIWTESEHWLSSGF
jgi:hypothetical protein